MDLQTLLIDFLNNLNSITDDELFAELEQANKDSQDSFLLENAVATTDGDWAA